MAKKTTNKKISSSKAKKNVDVSNVDAIMEDMKNLALQKTEDEKVETKVEGKRLDDVVYGNGIAKKPEEVESDVNTDMKDVDIVTTQLPPIETENLVNTDQSMSEDTNNVEELQSEIENAVNTEQSILKDTNNVEEQNLSFVEEINKGEVIVEEDETKIEEKPKKIENKPKRKSYSEMFGNTWCGYGYTTD